ncbi:MAG: DNA polymerase III subunit gamma/tau [candidate division KSB1 bacterium]|nr:DNA polymerase III subunit gamma/tau [candidate division KSB1 bacterium]
MSYLVLARKYRPMRFEDVVGQQHVTATLRNAISLGRLANAYLFAGPRGVGKTSVARILAKALNCDKGPSANPCNECSSCREITESRSLDVLEIDGASNRGIDEVRNLRETLRYAPSPGKHKIYIIDEVHMLTPEAFNALLKTLEEPPKHVLFIFATTEPRRVPPTILSRCQRFDFRRIAARDIVAQLKNICQAEGITISDEALLLIVQRADGSMRDAESILDQMVAYTGETISIEQVSDLLGIIDQELFFTCSSIIKNRDSKAALALADKVFAEGLDFVEFMVGLAAHLRNILIAKSLQSTDTLDVADHFAARYRAEAEEFASEDLMRLIKIASDTAQSLTKVEDPRVQFELALLRMVNMDRAVDLGELLRRLGESKKKPAPEPARAKVSAPTSPAPQAQPRVADRPQPPPAPSPVAIEHIKSMWPRVVEEVRRTRVALAVTLQEGVPSKVEGNVLEVMFRKGNGFHMRSVERGRSCIEEVVARLVGQSLRIKCVQDEQGLLGEAPQNTPREQFQQMLQSNPALKALAERLGAEPVE